MDKEKNQRCACGQLQRATRAITQFYDRRLRPAGIRTSQYSMLNNIKRAGELSVGELGAMLRMDHSTAVRNVSVLRKMGLVETTPGRDARRKMVTLSAQGRLKLDEAHPYWEKAQSSIEKGLKADLLISLSMILDRLQELADEE